MKRAAILLAVALLAAAAPQPGEAEEPRARAWAVKVSVPVSGGAVELARTSSESGRQPVATAVPATVFGQQATSATADLGTPDAEDVLHTYEDPTGSMLLEAGFAEAHVTKATSSARAGFGSMSGSGFALASELFTFEQQEQTLNQWKSAMDAVFVPLNEQIDALSPLLGGAGLSLPRLEGIAPEGLIDVGRARQVASSAQTSSSPGFSSARADATLGEIRLFGGFIEARGVSAEAISESVAGADQRGATARIGSLFIAGIEVVADGDGFRVAGNDVITRTAVQPGMDLLLSSLADAGLTIRALDEAKAGDLREAAALEVQLDTPQGPLLISIAHAEASAASVGALPPPAEDPIPPRTDDGPEVSVLPDVVPRSGGVTLEPAPPVPAPPGSTQPQATGPLYRRPGPAEARSMKTTYLLFMVGALALALGTPLMVRRPLRRVVPMRGGTR